MKESEMKIATILPINNLHIEANSDYHMCLAHLMRDNEYRKFFEWQVSRGAHVIMDNGVVETGKSLHAHELLRIAQISKVTEMTLPDAINDREKTLRLHKSALDMILQWKDVSSESSQFGWGNQKVMLIPQGNTIDEWILSVIDMLELAEKYPRIVSAIGISKFCVGQKLFSSRFEALQQVPILLVSGLAIHLLGCPIGPNEIQEIDVAFNGRIRGVDSGLPVFYTQSNQTLTSQSDRPAEIELDFYQKFDEYKEKLLRLNVRSWKHLISYRGMKK